jgi:hypothetical protein
LAGVGNTRVPVVVPVKFKIVSPVRFPKRTPGAGGGTVTLILYTPEKFLSEYLFRL